jgi:DNA replication licensing factor MCM3
MIAEESKRLLVNINDLRRKHPARALSLLNNAFEEQHAFSKALKDFVSSIQPSYAKTHDEFYVAFEGSFGNKHVTPRQLTSRFLGSLVCVEGIVVKVSLVRPKVVRSVHFCPGKHQILEKWFIVLSLLFDSYEQIHGTQIHGRHIVRSSSIEQRLSNEG